MSLKNIFLSTVLISFFFNSNSVLAQDSPIDIKHLEVTDLSLSSAKISWVTDEKTSSNWVEVYSTDPDTVMIFDDTYKALSYVHEVNIISLSPEKEYKFRVGSGDMVWDNEGELYSFKTLASSSAPPPSTILQQVTDTWGNPLGRVLVRIRLKKEGQDPSLAKTLLTSNEAANKGYWVINWTDFYAEDGSLYNAWTGDRVIIHYIPNYWSEHSDSSAVLTGTSPQSLGKVSINVFDPNEVIKGDLDSNGEINIFDLLDLLKILSGKLVPEEQRLFGAADVDTSGTINIFDLLALLGVLKG